MPREVEKASILRQQSIAEHLLENAVLCRCVALFQLLCQIEQLYPDWGSSVILGSRCQPLCFK